MLLRHGTALVHPIPVAPLMVLYSQPESPVELQPEQPLSDDMMPTVEQEPVAGIVDIQMEETRGETMGQDQGLQVAVRSMIADLLTALVLVDAGTIQSWTIVHGEDPIKIDLDS